MALADADNVSMTTKAINIRFIFLSFLSVTHLKVLSPWSSVIKTYDLILAAKMVKKNNMDKIFRRKNSRNNNPKCFLIISHCHLA